MPSRIKKHNYTNNYCELDGTPCIRCRKCEHVPNCSSSRSSKWLFVFVIAFIIIFVLLPLYHIGIEKHNDLVEQSSNNSLTLENKVDNYNAEISADEKAFREAHGLSPTDSYGEHYNPMG